MTPSERLSSDLRALVAERANYQCEYCLMPEWVAAHKHEPDHIVPRQHGGVTEAANLALSCMRCNRRKGPNVGSFDPLTGKLTSFFNPRTQQWDRHFKLVGSLVQPLTPEGRVTVKILGINDDEQVSERRLLIQAGMYKEN